MHKTSFTFRLTSVLGLLGCAALPAAAQSTGDILFYKKAAGAGYDAIYLTPINNRILGFNGSGALTLSVPFSGAFSDLTGKPTTLSGYGITDSVVLTTGTYVNPGFISSLAWSKIASTPSSLAGYGITDAVANTRTVNGHALSADVTVTKSDVGLGSVANTDTTNASNITSGTLAGARLQTQMSLTSDGSGVKLSGDASTPGNSQYYGTNGSGTKGFYGLPLLGGSSGDVQYNNSGVLAGLSGMTTSSGVLRTLSLSPANNSTGLALTGGSITGSGATPFASFTGTWNTSGSPAGMKWLITDTASNDTAGNTRLMDWLVDSGSGAVSQFYVSKVNASNEQVAYFKGRDLSLKVDGGSNGLKFGSNSLDPIGTLSLGSNTPFASLNCSGTINATTFTAAGGDFVDIINTVASGGAGMRLLTAGGFLYCLDGFSNGLWRANLGEFEVTSSKLVLGSGTAPFLQSNSGSPEGVVTAPVGSLYLRTDGGTSTTLYVKESGGGNTGWIAK